MVDETALLRHWPAASRVVDRESLGLRAGAAQRVVVETPAGREAVLLRTGRDREHIENLIAVGDALSRRPGPWPRVRALMGEVLVEEWVNGVTAVSVQAPYEWLERAVKAIAELHGAGFREGFDWERKPAELTPGPEMQLFRLGFAAAAREAVRPWLEAAQVALCATPFGFSHRALTADHLLFAATTAWIVDFEDAGFGAQFFDLEAFLLTSGADASVRGQLAAHYARIRGLDPESTAGLADLAGLIWGLNWLLSAPRRQIEALGDDGRSEALRLMAVRVDAAIRETAGSHPVAEAIRTALWA